MLKDLITLFKSYEGRRLLSIPLLTNSNDRNHEEADTRLIFYALIIIEPAVIVGKDTDEFVLLPHVIGQMNHTLLTSMV